jgi:hydroxymethylglutaryl-CoA reductase
LEEIQDVEIKQMAERRKELIEQDLQDLHLELHIKNVAKTLKQQEEKERKLLEKQEEKERKQKGKK